mgnify:CR=1 FL=1
MVGAALVLAGACGDEAPLITPVVDTPSATEAAAVLPDADELRLSVYVEGDRDPILAATFARGEPIVLAGVPLGERIVIDLSARLGGNEIGFGRTCTFEVTSGPAAVTPHLFVARPRVWATLAGPAALARTGASGLTYHDGSGMVVGGTQPDLAAVTSIERFDPMTGTLSILAEVAPRIGAVAAVLGDGRVALVGGLDATTGLAADFFELVEADAAAERRVERLVSPALARQGLSATALASGAVLVAGGHDAAGPSAALAVLRVDGVEPRVVVSSALLATARSGHSATRLGNDDGAPVLLVGGLDAGGQAIAAAELYVPARDALADPAFFAPRLRHPRTAHRAVRLGDGSVLVLGGVDGAGQPVRAIELFAIDRGFTEVGMLPDEAGVVDLTVTELPDGRALLAGGRSGPGAAAGGASFVAGIDPQTGTFYLAPSTTLTSARAGHAAAVLCDDTVILAGGADTGQPLARYRLDRPR